MRSLLSLLLLALPIFAAEPTLPKAPSINEIRLPVLDTPTPMPPGPMAVTKLSASQLYIIDSDVELSVVASRDGFVQITPEAGPLKIKGVFVDDPSGKAKTRTFKGPFLYSVEVIATGQVELILFKDIKTPPIRRTLDVDDGTPAPIPPKPDPPTPTPPKPEPKPADSLWVIVIEESGQRTADTAKVIGDEAWKAGLLTRGHKYRLYDQDSPGGQKYGVAVKERPGLLLLDKDGDWHFAGPLPKTTAEIDILIKKAGGK